MSTFTLSATRRACLAVLSVGALLAPLAAHAQLQKITYLLPAPGTLPAFGPWMLAQAKGYYAAEGLEVEFVTGRGGVDVAKQVGAGNAVIGGAIGDTPIIARAQGIPVKAVAVLGSGSLMQLVSHKDERIDSPRELRGKTVTVLAYTDTSNAKLHAIDGIPMVLAGGANGKIKTGLHVAGGGTTVSRVGLTVQQAMGFLLDSWGTQSNQTNRPISEIVI